MKIRVMHVVSRWATGGTEVGVARIANRLNRDFEHVICSIHPPLDGPSLEVAELEHLHGKSSWRSLLAAIQRRKPQIVHSRNWGAIEAIVAARLAGVPAIIHSEHGRNLDTMLTLPWRQTWFRRFSYRLSHRLFAVTDELRQYYVAQIGRAAQPMAVIENGVDTAHFQPDIFARTSLRQRLGIDRDTTVIGCVARLDPVKDHRTLLRACSELSKKNLKLHLVMVGDGPERPRLEEMANSMIDLRPHVTFAGHDSNVASWLSAFDVFVLPSLSEGMSNVLLEAMAVGVVPVASAVGGNPEILRSGECGYLFAPGASGELANRLSELITNPARRAEMGTAARARVVERYALERMLDNYARLYYGVLARGSEDSSLLLAHRGGRSNGHDELNSIASLSGETLAQRAAAVAEGRRP